MMFVGENNVENVEVDGDVENHNVDSISYLMLSVEGSLGLRYLGIGRVGHNSAGHLG